VRADPASLARVVNAIGLASVTAALPLAWRYLARLMDEHAAAFAVAVFFFSPLVLHVSGSGHPLLLAFALCLAGALAIDRAPFAAPRHGAARDRRRLRHLPRRRRGAAPDAGGAARSPADGAACRADRPERACLAAEPAARAPLLRARAWHRDVPRVAPGTK